MHEIEVFRYEQCEYNTPRRDNLLRHIGSVQGEKNLKFEECDCATNSNYIRWKNMLIHSMLWINACDFSEKSFREMKIHKNTEHEPDDFVEESGFEKTLYTKHGKWEG